MSQYRYFWLHFFVAICATLSIVLHVKYLLAIGERYEQLREYHVLKERKLELKGLMVMHEKMNDNV